MNENDPITPPPELVQQWVAEIWHEGTPVRVALSDEHIATRAAQWGADQQLAKDAKWLDHNALNEPHLRITPVGESLKEAMRPKSPSLKELALEAMHRNWNPHNNDDFDTIRRALEQLDD
jgi:hypothetical protein